MARSGVVVREVDRAQVQKCREVFSRETEGIALPTFSDDPPDHKHDIGGAFGEAAHEVWKPLTTEGDVHADPISFLYEVGLQIAADAVQHLKLETIPRDSVIARNLLGGG